MNITLKMLNTMYLKVTEPICYGDIAGIIIEMSYCF